MIGYFTFYVMCIALKEANKELTETVSSGKKASDKEMFSLSWTVDGLSRLVSLGRQLYAEVTGVLELLEDDQIDVIKKNVASRVSKLQESLFPFIREVTRHQRQKATHILVTMISPSQRSQKPYALPVSCIPYRSLTISQARTFINNIIMEMTKRNMKIAGMKWKGSDLNVLFIIHVGFVSNGEYNSFRAMGYTRPLSVLKIRSMARNKYSKMSVSKMESMLLPIGIIILYVACIFIP